MSHLDKAFDMLREASDSQLRKLYMKQKEQPAATPEEQPSEDDLALLEQSLMTPKG